MSDVVIIGGGVIGLSIAYELAGQGGSVTVLERDRFGREASWAGAGILPPANPETAATPESRLRAESHVRWPSLSAMLREETGIDNGYHQCGGLEVPRPGHRDASAVERIVEALRDEGIAVEQLSTEMLLRCEPRISREVTVGCRLPELGQVRNPRHLKALVAGCAARGVDLRSGQPVVDFERRGETITAVRTVNGTYAGDQFCVTGGAWSGGLLRRVGVDLPVEPVRGQIVLLSMQPVPFRHVILQGARYLVPRPDGRILIGSTEEWVGFDKDNTAGAVAELTRFGTGLVPALSEAAYERSWAGLRPGSPDRLPFLGRAPEFENLFVATGHFRSGLQMSPGTAVAMRQLILDQEPAFPLEPFACDRQVVQSG